MLLRHLRVPAKGRHGLSYPGVEIGHHPHDGQTGPRECLDGRQRLARRDGDHEGALLAEGRSQFRQHVGKHLRLDGQEQDIRPFRHLRAGIADADTAFLEQRRELGGVGVVYQQVIAGKSPRRHAAENRACHVAGTYKSNFHSDSPIVSPVRRRTGRFLPSYHNPSPCQENGG